MIVSDTDTLGLDTLAGYLRGGSCMTMPLTVLAERTRRVLVDLASATEATGVLWRFDVVIVGCQDALAKFRRFSLAEVLDDEPGRRGVFIRARVRATPPPTLGIFPRGSNRGRAHRQAARPSSCVPSHGLDRGTPSQYGV